MDVKIPMCIAVAVVIYYFGADGYDIPSYDAPEYCYEGDFLDIEGKKCEPCPAGFYMPDKIHSQIRCHLCSQPTPGTVEKVVKPCNQTSNTFIGCGQGFFLHPLAVDLNFDPEVIRCYPCSDCAKTVPASHQLLPCDVFRDTLCCPDLNMVPFREDGQPLYTCRLRKSALPNRLLIADGSAVSEDDLDLRSRSRHDTTDKGQGQRTPYASTMSSGVEVLPLKCYRGEFLQKGKGVEDWCQECPDGTFMDENGHTHMRCKPCTYDNKNENDITGCVSKKEKPRVIACSGDNMYVSVIGNDSTLAECKNCRNCSESKERPFLARPCSNKTDTVCCANPNVKVEDRDGEAVCTTISSEVAAASVLTGAPTRHTIGAFNSHGVIPGVTVTPSPQASPAESQGHWKTVAIIAIIVAVVIIIVAFIYVCYRKSNFCRGKHNDAERRSSREHLQKEDSVERNGRHDARSGSSNEYSEPLRPYVDIEDSVYSSGYHDARSRSSSEYTEPLRNALDIEDSVYSHSYHDAHSFSSEYIEPLQPDLDIEDSVNRHGYHDAQSRSSSELSELLI